MKSDKTASPIKGLGLCSGGLDSMLAALVLKRQGIDVTFICFETPFFSSSSALKAAAQTGIPLITRDITPDYLLMLRNPRAGFGKNMNPCMDCHALMFRKAGEVMMEEGFDFLFSGEVMGQRPKSQNKNSLRYVQKNSGFQDHILRPLSARLLPETPMELAGWVDREKLLDISGRSRKIQMELARTFGIKDYPAPAGGCLLTDRQFSRKLKDMMAAREDWAPRYLHMLKYGRHFRLDPQTKVIVGRSREDNQGLMAHFDEALDVLLKHNEKPGPDVILTGDASLTNIQTAAELCAAYSRSSESRLCPVKVTQRGRARVIQVPLTKVDRFGHLMV